MQEFGQFFQIFVAHATSILFETLDVGLQLQMHLLNLQTNKIIKISWQHLLDV